MAKRILMAVENLGMGGMKRAATVVGNAMTEFATVAFYQMADAIVLRVEGAFNSGASSGHASKWP